MLQPGYKPGRQKKKGGWMHTERDFENDIEAALLKNGGYQQGDPAGYDAERALFPEDTLVFVQATQPKIWQYLESLHKNKTPAVLIDSLAKELDSKIGRASCRERV